MLLFLSVGKIFLKFLCISIVYINYIYIYLCCHCVSDKGCSPVRANLFRL